MYQADLGYDDTLSRACQHPDNVWSLHGYHECLERFGCHAEAAIVGQKLRIAFARTDDPVTASCLCRLRTRQTRDGRPVASARAGAGSSGRPAGAVGR